jgi:thiol-disulfide isomerase/thioredoxin
MKAVFVPVLSLACAAFAWTAEAPRPEFPDIVISTPEGQACSVADFRGAVTVLNFWATWCGPCRIELPELQKLYDQLAGKGFVVAAINVEGRPAWVKPFFARMGLTMPLYTIDAGTDRLLGVTTIPFTVLLDRDGRVVRVYQGYSKQGMADLRAQVKTLLAKKSG